MTIDDVVERLDRLIGLYELVNSDSLANARKLARNDVATSAILDRAEDWVTSGTIKAELAKQLNTSEKTIQRRLAELVGRRAIESRRNERGIDYKATGLI